MLKRTVTHNHTKTNQIVADSYKEAICVKCPPIPFFEDNDFIYENAIGKSFGWNSTSVKAFPPAGMPPYYTLGGRGGGSESGDQNKQLGLEACGFLDSIREGKRPIFHSKRERGATTTERHKAAACITEAIETGTDGSIKVKTEYMCPDATHSSALECASIRSTGLSDKARFDNTVIMA